MSNLVEAVAKAIHENSCAEDEVFGNDAMSNLYRHHARAAILAVAKWLDEQPLETGNEPYDLAPARLFRELERLRGDK